MKKIYAATGSEKKLAGEFNIALCEDQPGRGRHLVANLNGIPPSGNISIYTDGRSEILVLSAKCYFSAYRVAVPQPPPNRMRAKSKVGLSPLLVIANGRVPEVGIPAV